MVTNASTSTQNKCHTQRLKLFEKTTSQQLDLSLSVRHAINTLNNFSAINRSQTPSSVAKHLERNRWDRKHRYRIYDCHQLKWNKCLYCTMFIA